MVSAHPRIFLNAAEASVVRSQSARYPLLARTLADTRADVERALQAPIDVPQPGEAGGYAHEKHKQNYRDMQAAGTLYAITDDRRYATVSALYTQSYAIDTPTSQFASLSD